MEINKLITKFLEHYDEQNIKYSKYLENTKMNNVYEIVKNDKVILDDYDYNILGIFYHEEQIFMWGWILPDYSLNETKTVKEILNYGLNLDLKTVTKEHLFLKSVLLNSRIKLDTENELDILIAMSSYILNNKASFIYPRKTYENNKLVLTTYIIIKISNK